jgi:hypothetical protein
MPVVRAHPAKKRKESEALASRIERTGFEMFPCSGCEKRNLKCVVSDKESSGRCSECVLRGVSCDVEGIPVGEWRALELETDRLEREKAIAFSQIGAAQRLMSENLARLQRLERQEKFLKSKGKDMVRRGLKTLDELEEVEEKERQMETERAAVEAAATQVHGQAAAADPFAGIEIPLLPPEVWANWDFASETPQASQGN